MKRLAILLVMLCVIRAADGQEAQIKCSLDSGSTLYVGQRVTMVVELFSPTYFSGTPIFDLPKVPGVVILPPQGHPILRTTQINGVSYTSQRHELWLFAQRAGSIEIPAFSVRFETTGVGGAPPTPVQLMTERQSFAATLPPGAEGLSTLISSSKLTVSDDWQPATESAKVGDALTHHITLTAADVPGMAFPPLPAVTVKGLGVYPKLPEVDDDLGRGQLEGHRKETITYVCQAPGEYTIPAFSLTWWDLDAHVLKTEQISGRTFKVAAAAVPAETNTVSSSNGREMLYVLGALIFIVAIGWSTWRPICHWLHVQRLHRSQSESGLFALIRKSCQAGDARHTYIHLLDWWQQASPDKPASSFAAYVSTHGQIALANAFSSLEQSLYGHPKTTSDRSSSVFSVLDLELRRFRKNLLVVERHSGSGERTLSLMNATSP